METQKFTEITDEEIERLFERWGVVADDVVKTADSLDDFKTASNDCESHGGFENGTVDGHPLLVIKKVQLKRGRARGDIIVVDMGTYRLVYAPHTKGGEDENDKRD